MIFKSKKKKPLTDRDRFLHKNIKFLLEKSGVDNKTLALQTGIPAPTIVRMKKPDNNPTLSSIEPIADFFRVDLDALLYEDLASETYQMLSGAGEAQFIPVINLQDIEQWPPKKQPTVHIGTVGNLSGGAMGILIDTTALAPIFSKQTTIILEPQVKPKDGDYVLVNLDAETTPVIRQVFIDGSNYFFKPLNPNYGEMSSAKKFEIIGVIVKSVGIYR